MRNDRADALVNGAVYRVLAWSGVACQAAALVAVAVLQRWNGVWSLAIFLVVSTGFLLLRPRLPNLLSFLVIVAAVINAVGWAWNLFNQVSFYDEMVHAFTAFAVMAAIGHFARTRGYLDAPPGSVRYVLTVTAVGLALGALWEVAEALVLNLSLTDTLIDLAMDALGAAVGGAFAGWVIRHQEAPRRRPTSESPSVP